MNEDFDAFATFSKFLNFTRAAGELHISQPALHLKVRNLERRLGRKLYERRGRALVLTPWGERVARYAKEGLDRHEVLLRDLHGESLCSTIGLASHDAGFLHILPEAIRAFWDSSHRPLRLLHFPSEELVAVVLDKVADVAVTVLSRTEPQLHRVPIARYPLCAVLRTDHRLASRTALRLNDLNGEKLIVTAQGTAYREMVSRNLAEAGVQYEVALETNSAHLMHHFALMGVGIVVRSYSARLEEGLVAIPINGFPELEFAAVFLHETARDDSVMRLVHLMCELAPKVPARASSR
jgi:DNA-binding transcriptional LysR family regulator